MSAIASVLVLLLGSFAQQTVMLELRQVASDHVIPAIPIVGDEMYRMYPYSFELEVEHGDNPPVLESHLSVRPSFKSIILKGLGGAKADYSSVTSSDCESNCTFAPYTTIGVCSSVRNYTSQLLIDCDPPEHDKMASCNYTVAELQDNPAMQEPYSHNHSLWLGSSAYTEQVHGEVYQYPEASTLSEFYIFYPTPEAVAEHWAHRDHNGPVRLIKGTMSLCLLTFDTTVISGNTSTEVVRVENELTWDWLGTNVTDYSNRVSTNFSRNDKASEFSMSVPTKQSITNFLSREVFWGKSWPASPLDLTTSTSDAARAFGERVFHNGSIEMNAPGFEGVEALSNNIAMSLTNA